MLKNNLLLFILLFLLPNSIKVSQELLISQWNNSFRGGEEEEQVLERALADAPVDKCVSSLFTLENLRAEVKELEKKYINDRPISGTWRHLNLSGLPVPQGNFLKIFGNRIGNLAQPNSIDYSSCRDLICIFNKIYGKDDHYAGYVHYLWFLKFGHMLSADNHLPSTILNRPGVYNNKNIPLEGYLLSNRELFGFWRVSLMLSSPHKNLRVLSELQRIPRGHFFEQSDYRSACGLAHRHGWIMLTDVCLSFGETLDRGAFYHGVIHELTHHVDYEEGKRLGSSNRSYMIDYFNLSGLQAKEYINNSGRLVRAWGVAPGAKVVTKYAAVSPPENFAESLTFFRINGDGTKKAISQPLYEFISKNFYQGKKYEKLLMMGQWQQKYSSDIDKAVLKIISLCAKPKQNYFSNYFRASELTSTVSPQMLSCLGALSSEIPQALRAKTSLNEPEGCFVHRDFKLSASWNKIVRQTTLNKINNYLQNSGNSISNSNSNDVNFLEVLTPLHKLVDDSSFAEKAFMNCYGEKEMEACYQKELNEVLRPALSQMGAVSGEAETVLLNYPNFFPLEKIKEKIMSDYSKFILGQSSRIKDLSEKIWNECKNISHDDNIPPLPGLFQISSGYLVSSFSNCLNSKIPPTVKEMIESFSSNNMRVTHPKEHLVLTQEINPRLVKFLSDLYHEEKAQEAIKATDFISSETLAVRNKILSDLTWLQSTLETNGPHSSCSRKALSLIDFSPLYHTKIELFKNVLENEICNSIDETPQFKTWWENVKNQFTEEENKALETNLKKILSS